MNPELWYYLRFAITAIIFGPIYAYFRGYSVREAIQLILFVLIFNGFVLLVSHLISKSRKTTSD